MSDSHKGAGDTAVEQQDDDRDLNPLNQFQQWREGIRERPGPYRLYKIGVGVLGGGIVIGGLALVPLPGPGWVIVFVGLAILATEFVWAQRLETYARKQLKLWTDWLSRQSWPVKVLVGLVTFAFVCAVIYAVLYVLGLPGWVPDSWLDYLPGLSKG